MDQRRFHSIRPLRTVLLHRRTATPYRIVFTAPTVFAQPR
jgi:hypothetical protein